MASNAIPNPTTKNPSPAAEKQTNKPYKPFGKNYKQVHALPLPLQICPLPPLIPHNPFSVVQIVLTYLYQLVSQPPSHHRPVFEAYISSETLSVHVTEEEAIRALWEQGFFGKGSLSRSEPSWLDRERRRKGVGAIETSEEVTKRRREERKEFKKERARKETEAVEEKLKEEGNRIFNSTAKGRTDSNHNANSTSEFSNRPRDEPLPPPTRLPSTVSFNSSSELNGPPTEKLYLAEQATSQAPIYPCNAPLNEDDDPKANQDDTIMNQEHLQLTAEEAFFLVYGLGVLQISTKPSLNPLHTASLFSLFRQNSYFPPCSPSDLRPDDPFLLSYVVYHHFRSLGWVVRPGVKFAVDYLLYNRGPVFSHAEFAVIILPSYRHPYWYSNTKLAESSKKRECKSWRWLHCINRVQSQVRKSLLLVYVEVPSPAALRLSAPAAADSLLAESDSNINITRLLKQYGIRELTLRRWTPNRSRD